MEFKEKVNNLIDHEKELASRAIKKLREEGFDFPVVYLPNFMPEKEVDYFFVAMEPSFGKWGNVNDANELIAKGFKNFVFSKEDYLLHFAINNYLSKNYHITDVSKIAMEIGPAKNVRKLMYDFWTPYLKNEFETLSSHSAKIISIGDKPLDELNEVFPNKHIQKIIHFSGAAQRARKEFVEQHIEEFENFLIAFKKEEVEIFSEELFKSKIHNSVVRNFIKKHSYKNLNNINPSDLKLLFNYKTNFEKILKN